MSHIQYQLISDQVRRALIRYYHNSTQVIGEYAPQLINSDILHPIFATPDLHRALNEIGISCSHEAIYNSLQDPFNPIVDLVENNPLLQASQLMPKVSHRTKYLYYIRPYHQLLDMIEENAFFREYEYAYRNTIPPMDFFEEVLEEDQRQPVQELYTRIRIPRTHRTRTNWQNLFRHFSTLNDSTRTDIADAFVTGLHTFKVAFLNAIIKEGQYSLREMFLMTGINQRHLHYVLLRSGFILERRYQVVEAASEDEAREQTDEPCHVVKLPDGKFLLLFKSQVRHRTPEELAQTHAHLRFSPSKKKKEPNPFSIKTKFSTPKFQKTFVTRKLRQVIETSLRVKIPLRLFDTEELLSFARNRLDSETMNQ